MNRDAAKSRCSVKHAYLGRAGDRGRKSCLVIVAWRPMTCVITLGLTLAAPGANFHRKEYDSRSSESAKFCQRSVERSASVRSDVAVRSRLLYM